MEFSREFYVSSAALAQREFYDSFRLPPPGLRTSECGLTRDNPSFF